MWGTGHRLPVRVVCPEMLESSYLMCSDARFVFGKWAFFM